MHHDIYDDIQYEDIYRIKERKIALVPEDVKRRAISNFNS